MAGISSKALNNVPGNRQLYNGIEFSTELEENIYDAEFRELDPTICRWWQVDPVTTGYENYSPYAAMYDNPVSIADPLGDEGEDCCGGIGEAARDFFDYVMINGSGLMNGMVNTLSGGHISTDPFDLRERLTAKQQGYYDGAVSVGQVGALFGFGTETPVLEGAPALPMTNSVSIPLPTTMKPLTLSPIILQSNDYSKSGKGTQNEKVREAIKTGVKAHKDFSEKAKAKGWDVNPTNLKDPINGKMVKPDAVTKSGKPIELKPNTPTGRAKGAKQLPKYERATGQKGRVVTYDPTKVNF